MSSLALDVGANVDCRAALTTRPVLSFGHEEMAYPTAALVFGDDQAAYLRMAVNHYQLTDKHVNPANQLSVNGPDRNLNRVPPSPRSTSSRRRTCATDEG